MAKLIGNQNSGYKINGKAADASGTFNINAEDLNAAPEVHVHEISAVNGLQTALDAKADGAHIHDYVRSISANGTDLGKNISLSTTGDLAISASGNQVTFTAQVPSTSAASSIVDSNDNVTEIKTWVGTQAQWDAFVPEAGVKYMVYIHA